MTDTRRPQTNRKKIAQMIRASAKRVIASTDISTSTRKGNKELDFAVKRMADAYSMTPDDAKLLGQELGEKIVALSQDMGRTNLDQGVIQQLMVEGNLPVLDESRRSAEPAAAAPEPPAATVAQENTPAESVSVPENADGEEPAADSEETPHADTADGDGASDGAAPDAVDVTGAVEQPGDQATDAPTEAIAPPDAPETDAPETDAPETEAPEVEDTRTSPSEEETVDESAGDESAGDESAGDDADEADETDIEADGEDPEAITAAAEPGSEASTPDEEPEAAEDVGAIAESTEDDVPDDSDDASSDDISNAPKDADSAEASESSATDDDADAHALAEDVDTEDDSEEEFAVKA